MTIALWCPTNGFSEYKWFALIDDGEVVRGDYVPPRNVDLSDEEALLHRYNGPGVIASKFDGLDDEELQQAERVSGVAPLHPSGTAARPRYRCFVCGSPPGRSQPAGAERRWIECPACQTHRVFRRIEQPTEVTRETTDE